MAQVNAPNRYYFLHEETSIVYFSETYPEERMDLIYIGTSNNPIPKSAATAFMQKNMGNNRFKVKPLE
jgi:predicted secreted protein